MRVTPLGLCLKVIIVNENLNLKKTKSVLLLIYGFKCSLDLQTPCLPIRDMLQISWLIRNLKFLILIRVRFDGCRFS